MRKNCRQLRKAGSRRGGRPPEKRAPIGCVLPKSPQSMHTSNTTWTEHMLFSNIYEYASNICMQYVLQLAKRGHEFEGQRGGVYESVWRKRREGSNVAIIISKENKKNKNPIRRLFQI